MLFTKIPRVDLVSLRGRQIAFRSKDSYKVGKRLRVVVCRAGGECPTRLTIEGSRALWRGGFLHIARTAGDHRLGLEPYERYCHPDREPMLRSQGRRPFRARVLSAELPGYRAVTVDISSGGLQLETEARLETGQVLNLVIEAGEEQLRCQARVAWCREDAARRFRTGLEVVEVPADSRRGLEDLTRSRRAAAASPADPAPLSRTTPEEAGRLVGYTGNGTDVVVEVRVAEELVRLPFPRTEVLWDCRGFSGDGFARVSEVSRSPLLSQARARQHLSLKGGASPLRHYRFLTSQGRTVLEIVAQRTQLPAGWLHEEKRLPSREGIWSRAE